MKIKNCIRCGLEFKPKYRQKYCLECKGLAKKENRAEKIRMGFETGHLFGKSIEEVVYERYSKSAIKRGIEFHISFEEFKSYWQQPCYYCASPINTIGLDRYDSDQGYVSRNIVPCCTNCNLSKRKLNGFSFIEMCKMISNNHK